jgi:hypothetical protein
MTTFKLVDPADVAHFEAGEKVDIEDLSEAEARAIFGDPVYETWRRWKDNPRQPAGVFTVTAISGQTITFGAGLPNGDDKGET